LIFVPKYHIINYRPKITFGGDCMLPHEMPSYEKAAAHKRHCKICNCAPEVVDDVNGALLRGRPLKEVQSRLEHSGCDAELDQIARHRSFLPFLINNKQLAGVVSDCRNELYGEATAEVVSEQAKVVADARLAYEYAKTICQMQLWSNTVPHMLGRLSAELEGNKAIPVRDLAYALDLIVKNGNLLGGGATERLEFNGQVKSSDNTALGVLLRTDPEAREELASVYRRAARLQTTGDI
jgi:hypothetical protein